MRLISAIILAIVFAVPLPASAMTCTARHKACLSNCEKLYPNRPGGGGCTSACAGALPVCMSTGCWKTPQANKCGYTKR